MEAKIDELLAYERAKAAAEGREFGPEAAKSFEEQIRAILSSKDARKRPAQEALTATPPRPQDAADELMKVAAQEGAAAADFAREAAETYREAAALYYSQQPQKSLEAYREATRLDASDFWSWIYLARLEDAQAGDVAAAIRAVERAVEAASNDREKSQALEDAAELNMKLDDVARARQTAEQSLEIRRGIAESADATSNDKRNVSISLERLGDVEVQAGDLAAARMAFSESLELRRALAEANPKSGEAQRDVSVSLNKLGDVEVKAGSLAAALTAFEEDLAIALRLAEANPDSAEAQRDVSVSLNKLGDVEVAAGNLAAARTAFEECLQTRRTLAEANPESAQAQRDVIASLDRLGKVTGDAKYWQEALEIAEALEADGRLAPSDAFIPDYLREQIPAAE